MKTPVETENNRLIPSGKKFKLQVRKRFGFFEYWKTIKTYNTLADFSRKYQG
ncbi:hypothetical protein [Aequorivita echinoideorum]|uniref:Uncharacterized protein n=1 Tax=Aequorivita echinoideorum TaxID=1549647 RepID=A0ABS5S318_9FLAO|nr:hypothetical protein [Aequorivita echinoideorum]MBT0607612.1 hypothetical protein [Aequorivita echinoideorum]